MNPKTMSRLDKIDELLDRIDQQKTRIMHEYMADARTRENLLHALEWAAAKDIEDLYREVNA